jgi:hypothetical protein
MIIEIVSCTTSLNSFYYIIYIITFGQMVKKKATKSKTMSKTKTKKGAAPTRRKAASRATSSNSDEKYKAQYTTRHGSHLTKTTVGVSNTEADIKEEVE